MKRELRTYKTGYHYNIHQIYDYICKFGYRNDADSLFKEVAHNAAVDGCVFDFGKCGCQGVTFSRPTNAKNGYYNIMRLIDKTENCTNKDLVAHVGRRPYITLGRLRSGRLIEFKNHVYTLTERGKIYLMFAENYVTSRKSSVIYG